MKTFCILGSSFEGKWILKADKKTNRKKVIKKSSYEHTGGKLHGDHRNHSGEETDRQCRMKTLVENSMVTIETIVVKKLTDKAE